MDQADAQGDSLERALGDPPPFEPPPEMRRGYLERRRAELEAMQDQAANGEWKLVVKISHHVRGTGAMYGFPAIGEAAEHLDRAIQNGDPQCVELLARYVDAVVAAKV